MAGFGASVKQREKTRHRTCLFCMRGGCDPAHLIPRSLGGCDHEDCVIPLCREHHTMYDTGRLNILYLVQRFAPVEYAHAVKHVGHERADWRISNQRNANERKAQPGQGRSRRA